MTSTIAHLDWDAIYLTCFGVGLALSVITFVGGSLHLHFGHLRLGGHGHVLSRSGLHGTHSHAHMSPVNGFTVVTFLCWFGGTGYLLTHGGAFAWAAVFGLSALSGFAGSGLVFWLLVKVLLPRERTLEPEDTPMVGILGRVSSPVPRNGVGEMLYSQNGARRSMPICSEDGAAIDRNAEVVVLRYQRGIGYVRRWDELQQTLLGDAPAAQNAD